jgi:hypothetical protein
MQECREKDTRDDRIFSRGIEKLTLPLIHVGALTKSISPPQVTKTQVLTKGVFEGVARGLGCAPRSPFLCLASSPPPSTRPARAKSPLSAWLPWYAIFHRSTRARLSAALAGDFRALCAGGGWPCRAHAGEGKLPPALLRHENHGL